MKSFQQIVLDEYFEPTIGKAVRVMLALVLPLIWGMAMGRMEPAVWIAIAAQVLTSVNIRGAYPLKLLILSGAALACAVAAWLGTLAGGYGVVAVLLMMVLAFLGGFVRQSGDHGPGITVAVLLLYLLALDSPGNMHVAGDMFLWVLEGGLLALLSTLAAWAFVPFSPFRRSIALTWKALAEWLQAFAGELDRREAGSPVNTLDEKELALRNELNDSMETLSRRQGLAHAKRNRYSFYLVELRKLASEAGNAVSSLRAVSEAAVQDDRFPGRLFHYLLDAMRQAAHRVAVGIITRRPEDIYTIRLSVERIRQQIGLFLKEADALPATLDQQIRPVLDDLVHYFESALAVLERSSGRQGRMTFFLQNFFTGMTIPQQVPRVRFEFSARSFTFRFSLRLALGMGIGIALYKYFHIPHGYWIAMTTMIVLQPEFGATITKAFNRTKGTVLGAVIGSLLFLVHLPLEVNVALVVICSFFMTYFLLRNYAVAAFFITVMVIALFHLLEPVTWQLGGIRVMNTLAGCGLAMLGGYAFWPLWEKYRFPALINKAILANRQYLNVIGEALKQGKKLTFDEVIKVRREAEMTNNNVFLCLRRMENEPEHERRHLQHFFLIAGYNIRVTRLLNTLTLQAGTMPHPVPLPMAGGYFAYMEEILQQAADVFGERNIGREMPSGPGDTAKEIKTIPASPEVPGPGHDAVGDLLGRIARETVGMSYAIRQRSGGIKL